MKFCPDCSTVRPATAFRRLHTGNRNNDRLGLLVRCNNCLALHRERKDFTRTHRAAALANPTSPLAAQWQEARASRLDATRRVRAVVATLGETSAPAFLVAV